MPASDSPGSESELVTVRILDREYQVMCAPDERRGLVDAAMYLDGQMRRIRDSGKLTSMDKIAVMCALNLSDDLLKLRADRDARGEQVDQRILELARRVEAGETDA
jgi:cell division protein ZapA